MANDPTSLQTRGEIPPSDAVHVESSATAQPPAIAFAPDILGLVADELADAGVAGESRAVKLLYLVVTTRLMPRPCSIVVKGPSSGGKSFLVGQVLALFPLTAYHSLSAMSDRALAYDTEPLRHRMLVIYEAAGLQSDIASYLMRSLLSEGHINYTTVEVTNAGLKPRRIERVGPTGLITTTTAISLHPENETRLLSLTVNDTPAQTRAVMRAHVGELRPERDRRDWHEMQSWLADEALAVTIPFDAALAEAIPSYSIRVRRDFPALLTLVRAHALLHQCSRERDERDAVIATLDDYAAVRSLVWDLMADAAERSVSPEIRETIAAVEVLSERDVLMDGVRNTQVAAALGIDKSTAMRRTRTAVTRGFLHNLETGRGRPARLLIGDPVPDDASFLPTVEELARLHGCAAIETDYPRSAWDIGDLVEPETPVETPVGEGDL